MTRFSTVVAFKGFLVGGVKLHGSGVVSLRGVALAWLSIVRFIELPKVPSTIPSSFLLLTLVQTVVYFND